MMMPLTATVHPIVSRRFPIRNFQFDWFNVSPFAVACFGVLAALDIPALYGALAAATTLGTVRVDVTVIPAAIVVLLVLQQTPRSSVLTTPRAIAMGIFVGCTAGAYAVHWSYFHRAADTIGYTLLALKEEAVYRVALPIFIACIGVLLGLSNRKALLVGLTVSAVVFAVLPGHVAQVHNPGELLVFVCFAAIMSYVIWEGHYLIAAIFAHAATNLITDSVLRAGVNPLVRTAGSFVILLALILMIPTAPAIDEDDDGIVIDLRDQTLARERARTRRLVVTSTSQDE